MAPRRLADAVSPYLRAHADNPVDWWPWGREAFAEARRRDVPVLVSIGYATCHWCHVMARETFSDPAVAAYLNARFVCVKVDREEHPEVDASFLAAASAFTRELGWPLTVFATPEGRTFFAGTYFPPQPVAGRPSFAQVLDAVQEAWRERRPQIERTGRAIVDALAERAREEAGALLDEQALTRAVAALAAQEDREHGGFGDAPKFPVATVLLFLLDRGEHGDAAAGGLAERALAALARSPLRDPVEGGFFRYAVRRDWSEPHYERMLYDNALLLRAYARAGMREVAEGVAGFLLGVLRLPHGAFASAQDSESEVDGRRVEGGYYALDREERARQGRPALDEKVLAGWNGLAIEALADAGALLERREWVDAAARAADAVLDRQVRGGRIVRVALGARVSDAPATLEDHGMLANGLLRLALVTGEVRYAAAAREIVDAVIAGDRIAPPGAGDPVLAEAGLAVPLDPSEGAYPSGPSATASAALTLAAVTGDARYRAAASRLLAPIAPLAERTPISFGAALAASAALAEPVRQLVVVGDPAAPLARIAPRLAVRTTAVVTGEQAASFAAAGFGLFEGRSAPPPLRTVAPSAGLREQEGEEPGAAVAYLCEDFVCRLPVSTAAALEELVRRARPPAASIS